MKANLTVTQDEAETILAASFAEKHDLYIDDVSVSISTDQKINLYDLDKVGEILCFEMNKKIQDIKTLRDFFSDRGIYLSLGSAKFFIEWVYDLKGVKAAS